MSLAYVTIKGCADARGLVCHLRPCWCLRAKLQLCHTDLSGLLCRVGMTPGPGLWLNAMSVPLVLSQPGPVLRFLPHIALWALETWA